MNSQGQAVQQRARCARRSPTPCPTRRSSAGAAGLRRQLTSPIPSGTPTHTDQYFHYKTDYRQGEAAAQARPATRTASRPRCTSPAASTRAARRRSGFSSRWPRSGSRCRSSSCRARRSPAAAEAPARRSSSSTTGSRSTTTRSTTCTGCSDPTCCDYTNYNNKTGRTTIDKNLLSTDQQARTQRPTQDAEDDRGRRAVGRSSTSPTSCSRCARTSRATRTTRPTGSPAYKFLSKTAS